MAVTSIEWTDRSVNPIRARLNGRVGHHCEKVSPGCTHCYSSKMQPRFGLPPFEADKRHGVESFLDETRFREVLRRRTPTKWFWCDMSDLFGSWVPDAWIDACFAVMALTPWHTHQVLTKRPERMRAYCAKRPNGGESQFVSVPGYGSTAVLWQRPDLQPWPLPNVWLGTSVENQATADARIPLLLETPAAIRFVSAEPLLEQIDIKRWMRCYTSARTGGSVGPVDITERSGFDWLIAGGESGHEARRCELAWLRSLVEQVQCSMGGTKLFIKQLGSRSSDIARPTHVTSAERTQWVADGWCRVLTNDAEFFTKHPRLTDRKGGDIDEFPSDLRVREFPGGAV